MFVLKYLQLNLNGERIASITGSILEQFGFEDDQEEGAESAESRVSTWPLTFEVIEHFFAADNEFDVVVQVGDVIFTDSWTGVIDF
jgi:hypothetical protein